MAENDEYVPAGKNPGYPIMEFPNPLTVKDSIAKVRDRVNRLYGTVAGSVCSAIRGTNARLGRIEERLRELKQRPVDPAAEVYNWENLYDHFLRIQSEMASLKELASIPAGTDLAAFRVRDMSLELAGLRETVLDMRNQMRIAFQLVNSFNRDKQSVWDAVLEIQSLAARLREEYPPDGRSDSENQSIGLDVAK